MCCTRPTPCDQSQTFGTCGWRSDGWPHAFFNRPVLRLLRVICNGLGEARVYRRGRRVVPIRIDTAHSSALSHTFLFFASCQRSRRELVHAISRGKHQRSIDLNVVNVDFFSPHGTATGRLCFRRQLESVPRSPQIDQNRPGWRCPNPDPPPFPLFLVVTATGVVDFVTTVTS